MQSTPSQEQGLNCISNENLKGKATNLASSFTIFKVSCVKLTVKVMKLRDKTGWNQLTELQKMRLVDAIREEREKALKREKRILGRADGPEWISKGLLVARVAGRGYNRKLVSEVVEELFYVEDGIVMGERREPAC